jgi:hypothetical protein
MGMEAANLRDGGRLKDIRACIDSLYGHESIQTCGVCSDLRRF